MDISQVKAIGNIAEQKVLSALSSLPSPWQIFNTVEWRNLGNYGEEVGEADVVVFNPQYGLIIFEVKAGSVYLKDGQWFYASGRPMKQSPFSQARRNRFALIEKLEKRLGKTTVEHLAITHAVWFPDVKWPKQLVIAEAPSSHFIFDRHALSNPLPQLEKIFAEIKQASSPVWTKIQQNALKELLAPDCLLLVPLANELDESVTQLHQATEQQIRVLRLLRTQKRLLIEGGAGSGKTLLATMMAREHAQQGKKILFTCYNKALALQLAEQLSAYKQQITVLHFHELVRFCALQAGLTYQVPADEQQRRHFFNDDCPELLMAAAEKIQDRYDSLIVDEAADMSPTWWIALESLMNPDFSWYCFYDTYQTIFHDNQQWQAPFQGEVMPLDVNLRNTQPIGEFAVRLGKCPIPTFAVTTGQNPHLTICPSFDAMADALRQTLHKLMNEEAVTPERIVILSPYRHTNPQSTWAAGLKDVDLHTEMNVIVKGKIRIGTIQSFKGLESDVVILVGLTQHSVKQSELLYVAASRAKAALYVFSLYALS
ncbi:MAG TPA: NERD domain-containing protein/DEAD/DEAH box helicase [Agitococcus sp.]|nr:NERD domain-containing protein/DEAD/DEAH box helicase [Agitococcus sp.]